MNSIELAGVDWLGRGWLLILAFTAAVLVAAALRKPCRRLFGTERAFQLWLLPPLAMLTSQLPHAAAAPVTVWSAMVSTVTSAAILSPMPVASMHAADWRAWVVVLWLAGIAASLLLAVRGQARYRRRLHGAISMGGVVSHCPVLRATTVDVGPALVGAWRSRIVLPADFEQRYSDVEQALILAHEAMHARRRDGWWCLLGRTVAAGFWFHPLAWWALSALRHDQELACDAAVLREHGAQRRSYANAMLKTQSAAIALPVGCPWSPRHPVTERIAMLKLPQPNPFRRHAGVVLLACVAVGLAGTVYAAAPSPQAKTGDGLRDHYTLQIDVAMGGHADSMHFMRCLAPGAYTEVSGTDTSSMSWDGRFEISPIADGQLEIRSQVDTRFDRGAGKIRKQSAKPVVRTTPGRQATIEFGEVVDDRHLGGGTRQDNTIRIRLTPSLGCDSKSLSSSWQPMNVDQQATSRSARAVAQSVAAKAGFVLVNPQALDTRTVTLNFEQMPATSALQLIADIDGLRAVFDDKRVRFEPK